MSSARNMLIAELQFIRDVHLEQAAESVNRDHIWNDDLAAIERDNNETDEDLRTAGSPIKDEWLALATGDHDCTAGPEDGCNECVELATHDHRDDPDTLNHPDIYGEEDFPC